MLLLLPECYLALATWLKARVGEGQDVWISAFTMWASTEITFWSLNLFFFAIEILGVMKQYRLHTESSNFEQFKSTLIHKPVTYLVDVPVYLLAAYVCDGSPFDPLPSSQELFIHVAVTAIAFDLMFYLWHRFLHTSFMWKFHKKHHEIKISYASANDHEDILELSGNIIWKMIPPMFMRSHVYTICVFRSVVKFFALLHHSGYELPVFKPLQMIPFMSSPSDHDFHHFCGHSNYGGVLMLWDWIAGTHVTWQAKVIKQGRCPDGFKQTLSTHDAIALHKRQHFALDDKDLLYAVGRSRAPC